MPQFSGHWYSGRAARLVFVEAALVAIALSISGQDARGWRQLAALMAVAACVPAALYLADLYDPQVMRNDRSRGASVLKALGFAALAAAIVGLIGGGTLPRGALIEIIGVASVGVLLARAALVARPDEQGHNRVLVIGAGQRAAEIERIVRTEAYGEYEVAGKLDPSVELSEPQQLAAGGCAEVIGTTAPLIEQGENRAAEVALAPAAEVVPASQLIVGPAGAPAQIQGPFAEAKVAALRPPEEKPLAAVVPLPMAPHPNPAIAVTAHSLTGAVRELRVDTVVIASDERRARLPIEEFIRLRLSGVTVLPAQRFAERVLRRVPIALLRPSDLAAPVLAIAAVLIKLDSEGPVFYWQERVGRGGRIFRLYKLRTMHDEAEKASGPVWAAHRDPRITRLGAMLRKTRLDELPQAFAVFRGHMSFVGPRPERPFFVQQLKTQIPFYGMREAVKPGITGWAQIRYPYASSVDDARAKLEYDLYYVQHQSLFLDLAICFHTVKTVLSGRGAR